MRDSSAPTNCLRTAGAGRFAPLGGIMPARSLWIIFSVTSRCCDAALVSQPASDNPPALPRSLWQVAQYCDTISAWDAGASAAECEATGSMAADFWGACCAAKDSVSRHTTSRTERRRVTGQEYRPAAAPIDRRSGGQEVGKVRLP